MSHTEPNSGLHRYRREVWISQLSLAVTEAYARAEEERSEIHRLEWDAGEDTASVLGESEVWCDSVLGVADAFRRGRSPKSPVAGLSCASLWKSKTLGSWIVNDSSKFPRFTEYLTLVECLRVALVVELGSE